jgi:hypothetical protein
MIPDHISQMKPMLPSEAEPELSDRAFDLVQQSSALAAPLSMPVQEELGARVVQEPRHVQRDAPSASRAYLARSSQGTRAFVKVLDPRANGSLQEAQNNLSQFIYEHAIVDVCAERNMHRVIRGLEYGILRTPEPFSVSLHYLVFEWATRSRLRFESEKSETPVT